MNDSLAAGMKLSLASDRRSVVYRRYLSQKNLRYGVLSAEK
ncbi:hypothetical protein SFMTTN_1045 [Sulfuriferula multivorans]|uniref:Uncharacterized protein n=1 Tax=Sulfuriferula multivorans TaxID=1559896 RepID=A0A401JC27_9PROT|nr:hypothetical protein [Sulfuriferula multivorans]GBL45238.1 hypothetical protein SFMTTN_1045 [Sulfuriferula multivorans]